MRQITLPQAEQALCDVLKYQFEAFPNVEPAVRERYLAEHICNTLHQLFVGKHPLQVTYAPDVKPAVRYVGNKPLVLKPRATAPVQLSKTLTYIPEGYVPPRNMHTTDAPPIDDEPTPLAMAQDPDFQAGMDEYYAHIYADARQEDSYARGYYEHLGEAAIQRGYAGRRAA